MRVLKKLKDFFRKEEDPAVFLIDGDGIVEMPPAKSPKPEKDISEPVHAFIRTVKDDPKRFTFSETQRMCDLGSTATVYTIVDRVTGEKFKIELSHGWTMSPSIVAITHRWLTDDELEYVFYNLLKWSHDRHKARQDRIDARTSKRERKRLMEIYN